MAFKSHLGRSMDFRARSNLLLIAFVVVGAGIALVLWLSGEPGKVFLAPVLTFLIWALVREIDPDHDWAALVGAAFAGAWVLAGGAVPSALAVAGLLIGARIVTCTTGRRLLSTDLAVVAVFGIAIGFTVEGWAAGFCIALAVYLDDRFRGENRGRAIAAASITAIGTTVVATASGAFPQTIPDVVQYMAVAAGVTALVLLVREPATPTTQVDARHSAFLDAARLYVSRSVTALLVFLMALLTGPEAGGLVVVVVALGLAIVSNEAELLRRGDR